MIEESIERYTDADLKISLFLWIHLKLYVENFSFIFLINLELFTRKVCVFLKT